MQNWNQWQLSAGTAATSMPQPPVGYAAPGGDPVATMQAYMQYYNQPAPTGYTTEQWAAAQQQNWAQWQQWQQQYQQWQAQYGEKYQETVKHMSAQNIGLANQVPPLPIVQPPPLPKEEIKPPLPPNPTGPYQFSNVPPPHQNNLPLFPAKEGPQNPPLPPSQPPLPPENSSPRKDNVLTGKRSSSTLSESSSAKKLKLEDEELTEAEKTFDAQFKQWEEQFNKWKQQNANHPDKTQYKQYEAKWTSWREKLIERREQMRRKREQQKQAAAKAEAEKNKSLPGDDKILNILSSTENQGLINNLLGIGKTLGLTGKQNTNVAPPPPPPPTSTESTTTNVETTTMASASQMTPVPAPSQVSSVNQMSSNITPSWNAQQWASQYNAGMNMSNFSGFQSVTGVPPPPYGAPPNTQLPPPNFAQPPPSFGNSGPNFSQPPPGFTGNDVRQPQNPNANRLSTQSGLQGRPPFAPNDSIGPNANLRSNDRPGQSGVMSNFEGTGQPSGNMGMNEQNRQKDGMSSLRYKNFSDQQGSQFRLNDPFGPRTDERLPETEPFRREERDYQEQGSNQFNLQKTNYGSMNDRFPGPGNDRFGQGSDLGAPIGDRFGQGGDRFGSSSDRFGAANNRFVSGNDRFGPSNDRYGSGNDRFGSGSDRFGSGDDRFGPRIDRFGPGGDRVGQGNDRIESNNDRFPTPSDRFGSKTNDHFSSGGDRFNRNSFDRFDPTDGGDNRRDSFSNNPRNFNRNNQFEPQDKLAPELKKLMEKRRSAMNVFKPSYLDNDKNVGVGSLSESFKRIAGDSPFMPKSFMDNARGGNNFGPRGPLNYNTGPGNFRMSGDFKSQGGSEFEPRGPPGFEPRGPLGFEPRGPPGFEPRGPPGFGPRGGAFDLRGMAPPFRGPNPSPQQVQDFTDSKSDAGNVGNNALPIDKDDLRRDKVQESSTDRSEPIGTLESTELKMPVVDQQSIADSVPKDCPEEYPAAKDTSLLEKSPWVDGEFPTDNSSRKDVGGVDEQNPNVLPDFGRTAEQDNGSEQTGDNKDPLTSNDDTVKKSEVLPFMGENDPKPEDLNMEPPPELPNLGPVPTGPGESYDAKRKPFPPNSECPEPRSTFDELGPRGMPFTPNIPPLLGNRGGDGRFPPFGPRGSSGFPFNPSDSNSDQLRPRIPNEGQFTPRGPSDGPFAPRGPSDGPFAPRGSDDGPFAPRGPNDGPFAPRGSNDGPFAPRGPSDEPFAPRGPNDGPFAPRGPNDGPFASRGPNDGPFAPRGSNEGQFRPPGPNNRQFDSRFPNDTSRFDSRGSGDVQLNSSRGPNMAQPGFPGPLDRLPGPRRPNDVLSYSRGPNENTFAPRGLLDSPFPKKGSKDGFFGPRGFNEKPFDTSNDGHFGSPGGPDRYYGPRAPMSGPHGGPFAPRSNNDGQFNNKMPFAPRGPGDFRPRAHFDPSVFPKPSGDPLSGGRLSEPDGSNLPNRGDESLSNVGKNMALETNEKIQIEQNPIQDQSFSPAEVKNSEWRQSYAKNSFGDTDQRSARDSALIDKPPIGQNEMLNQSAAFSGEQRSSFTINKPNTMTDKRSERSAIDSNSVTTARDFKSGYPGESPLGSSEYEMFGGPNMFAKRPGDNRQSQVRGREIKEFCIEKQFNYNHGEGTMIDKKFTEHVPAKVIDYAHTTRSSNQDYLTPVQCFDYGHGNLKPTVTEREVQPKKDFRHWEENEHNLKEYTEKIRSYERFVERSAPRCSIDYTERKIVEGPIDDKKYEREKREKVDYKVKERREDRMYDRVSDKDHDNRYQNDRTKNKERAQERCETSQRDIHKEKGKDIDDRSKGNVNWQDSSNKNKKETKPSDTSVPDNQHNVLESAPKTLDLPKTPNSTMVDDLLCPPGRQNRPPKIAIILRGPPGSGKSFVAKLIKDKEVEHGGSAPRILSLDDYFLAEKEVESKDDNGKKVIIKDMVYEYEEAMEQSYITSLVKAFKKNITDGFFNFIILDSINEKISDYDEMWSFAKTKGFKVYVCEMEMDLQICLKRNIHNRTEEEINRIIDYFEPTPSYHLKLDVNSMLQDQAIEEVHMEDTEEIEEKSSPIDEDSQDSQDDVQDNVGVSKWERMEAEDKLDRLDGLARKKNEGKVQTMKDFLQVPDYYNMEDTSGKKRVRWADLEERKEQEKMRAVGFVVGHTNWDRMMDPTKGGSALTRTKFFSLS